MQEQEKEWHFTYWALLPWGRCGIQHMFPNSTVPLISCFSQKVMAISHPNWEAKTKAEIWTGKEIWAGFCLSQHGALSFHLSVSCSTLSFFRSLVLHQSVCLPNQLRWGNNTACHWNCLINLGTDWSQVKINGKPFIAIIQCSAMQCWILFRNKLLFSNQTFKWFIEAHWGNF